MIRNQETRIVIILQCIIILSIEMSWSGVEAKHRCPDEFVYNNQLEECTPKCFPEYLKKEVLEGDIVGIILSILSFFSCWIYCLTAVLKHEQLLKFPASSIFWLHFSLWIFSMYRILPGFFGIYNFFCDDDYTLVGCGSSTCIIQTIVIGIGMTWSVLWWTFYNFTILLSVSKMNLKFGRKKTILNIGSWICITAYGIIITSVLLGLGHCQYYPEYGCSFGGVMGWDNAVVWGLFYIPIVLAPLVINTLIMIPVVVRLLYLGILQKQYFMLFKRQYRLLLFYVVFFTAQITFVYIILSSLRSSNEWYDNYDDYLDCINFNWETYSDISCCKLKDNRPSDSDTVISAIVESSLGLACFIILGIRTSFFTWWKFYIINIFTKRTMFPPSITIKSSDLQSSSTAQ